MGVEIGRTPCWSLLLGCVALAVTAASTASEDSGGTIITVAGTPSIRGSDGDGDAATRAHLDYPFDMVVAGDGALYVADTYNHRIRQVDPVTGNISTLAGQGVAGFSGDDGPADQARLNFPHGLALDPTERHLYLADTSNHRVRMIDLDLGTIHTVAGSGAKGLEPNGDGGPAPEASLEYPFDIAFGPDGALFIADTYRHRIRQVDLESSIIRTVVGTGAAGYGGDGGTGIHASVRYPYAIAVGLDGEVYVADSGNNRVRRWSPSTGLITTVAGRGPEAPFTPAVGAAIGGLTPWPGTLVGDGQPAGSAFLAEPSGVAVDAQGRVLIADTKNLRVRRIEIDGTITTIAGSGQAGHSGDGGAASEAAVHAPYGLSVDRQTGDLLIAQTGSHVIRRVRAPF